MDNLDSYLSNKNIINILKGTVAQYPLSPVFFIERLLLPGNFRILLNFREVTQKHYTHVNREHSNSKSISE
jgi:hypothetical protein